MVSVCVATYNGATYVRQQLESVLCQLAPDDEVVVSDDGSTDATLDVVRAMSDSRIRIVEGPKRGLTYNFENAINNAQGDYIFLCDQDDVWLPNKVERMVEELQSHDLVVSDACITDADLTDTGRTLFDLHHPRRGAIPTFVHTSYIGCCTAFRRRVLERLLPFPKNIVMHDYWVGQCCDWFYTTAFIPDVLMKYRRHGGNTSSLSEGSRLSLFEKISYRYWIMRGLLLRIFRQ